MMITPKGIKFQQKYFWNDKFHSMIGTFVAMYPISSTQVQVVSLTGDDLCVAELILVVRG